MRWLSAILGILRLLTPAIAEALRRKSERQDAALRRAEAEKEAAVAKLDVAKDTANLDRVSLLGRLVDRARKR